MFNKQDWRHQALLTVTPPSAVIPSSEVTLTHHTTPQHTTPHTTHHTTLRGKRERSVILPGNCYRSSYIYITSTSTSTTTSRLCLTRQLCPSTINAMTGGLVDTELTPRLRWWELVDIEQTGPSSHTFQLPVLHCTTDCYTVTVLPWYYLVTVVL